MIGLPEIIKEIISVGIPSATSIMACMFAARNSVKTEIVKKQIDTINNVLDGYLANGKITHYEYAKCNNIKKIAALADKMNAQKGVEEETYRQNFEKYNLDWFMKFYDYAGCVSDEDVQELWASVLANEMENPNGAPLSLLHALSIMEYKEALFFCNISRFVLHDIKDDSPHLMLFVSSNREAYKKSKITPEELKDLERLGLVECDFINEYIFTNKKYFRVGNHAITVYGDPNNDNKIKAGNVTFTKNGKILYSIIDDKYKQYNSEILNYTIEKFKLQNCNVVIDERKMI